MRKYKLVLLLKSDLKKEKKEKVLDAVKKWVGKSDKNGVKALGERKLAYPIKRERKGEYVLLEFEGEKVVSDLEKRILMQEDILRHLLVRTK